MSAPVIWILSPALIGAGLVLLRRWPRLVALVGLFVAGLLALMAWRLPIGLSISLGPWPTLPRVEIAPTLQVLGRTFTLEDTARPALAFIYLGLFFWYGGVFTARPGRFFIPLTMLVAACLTGALSVRPFLYAALLIELAILLCVPLLIPPGQAPGRGVLRFLVFQSLGMPLILILGWMLTGITSNPNDQEFTLRVLVIAGMAFAFLSAIFPFNTWLPMVGQEAHPYTAAFVFFAVPASVGLLGYSLLGQYSWLGELEILWQALRVTGALMALVGGVSAVFERHLGRMLGYAIVLEIGQALLALSLGGVTTASNPDRYPGIFFALLLPRLLSLALWSQALALLRQHTGGLDFKQVHGAARRLPVVSASVLLAQGSLAGLPLLAGFPIHYALWTALADHAFVECLVALIGSLGMLVAALSTLGVLVTEQDESQWQIQERPGPLILLALGWVLITLVGLGPQWFLPLLISTLRSLASSGL